MAILSFQHKGIERFYLTGNKAGIQTKHAARLALILAALSQPATPTALTFPGWRLHELQGQRKGTWSITVQANWRITFRFVPPHDVELLDYEDYH